MDDPLETFASGDRQWAEELRSMLRGLHGRTDDPDVRRAVGRVLDGSMSVEEMVAVPAVASVVGVGLDAFEEQWESLSADERTAVLRAGRERLGEGG